VEFQITIHQLTSSLEFRSFIESSSIVDSSLVLVGIFPLELLDQIGSSTRLVFLSRYTLFKGKIKHPDITYEDYCTVQRLLEEGEAIKEGREQYKNHIVFYSSRYEKNESGKYLAAAIKTTRAGDELFLSTIYHTTDRELNRQRVRGILIRQ